ncbi:MAG TPA: hypothetical protein VJY84_01290 [Candidatus Saccharimonadales bacterium]|nr:hypothetical protein [Candidatus Saccharimonadales bacterium]
MSVHSISTKELREQLPKVRAGLARGNQYLLIYRSKAIARLEPIKSKPSSDVRVRGGGLKLQANAPQPLTPQYLKQLATRRYE